MKKNKNILLKIFALLLAFTAVLSFCAVAASAESEDIVVEENLEASLTEKENATKEIAEEEAESEENIFSAVFSLAKDRAAEIFSVLTLICSLILAYAYKRGLFPLVQSALNNLTGSVNKIKESAERELNENGTLGSEVKEKLSDFEKLITAAGDKLALLEEKLDEKENRQGSQLKTVISAQIDMLYDVFMSSSLPQYQKEAIGQRVVKMKEALEENESD